MDGPQPVTQDAFLGGRLSILQPAQGYRAGGDPILLAAALSARPGETVLDLGCGVGTAGLCLLARLPQVAVTALEVQPELAALARANAAGNGLGDRMTVLEGSLLAPPDLLAAGAFDHVITNPPWMEAASSRQPGTVSKSIGHLEGEADLATWLAFAVRVLKRKGCLAVIHRADRLGDLLAALDRLPVGALRVFPLWPRHNRPAIRVIVIARKEMKTPMEVLPGLVLHQDDGSFTPEADAIMRQMSPLQF